MSTGVKVRLGLLAGTLLALLVGFHALFLEHSFMFFNDPKEDMTYAWFVPLFSLYVVWTERVRIGASFGAPSFWGLLSSLPFLFLGFLGARGLQIRLEIVSLAGLLVTIPWAFFGARTARRLLFPALFLLFCIPLSTYLDVITVRLRLFASSAAETILQGVGAGVVRTGTALGLPDGSFAVDVANPCSGLRSIFALTALTAGYAYFNQPTWIRRVVLFSLAIPLAIAGNVSRILSIFLVGSLASPTLAMGFYHDYSGYVVFLVSVFLMVVSGEILTRLCGSKKDASAEADRSGGKLRPDVVGVIPFLTTILVVLSMAYQARTPEVTVCAAPPVILGDLAGFSSKSIEVAEAERQILPEDTRIVKRLYETAGGRAFLVSAVVGGKSKASIHRPELCLPTQGFLMMNPHDLEIGGVSWRVLTLAGDLELPRACFAYTFYNQAGYRTSSHLARIFRDVWDRSVLNRIDRWVMVTVVSSHPDAAAFSEFLSRLKEVL